jgi:hypothetical protein
LENTICKLNEVFGEQEEYHKSLEELITAYGTRRIHTKDSTAWINFRGCYYKNNGFIINAMHTREGCYTYIKEIIDGNSVIVLSGEEQEALNNAMGENNIAK